MFWPGIKPGPPRRFSVHHSNKKSKTQINGHPYVIKSYGGRKCIAPFIPSIGNSWEKIGHVSCPGHFSHGEIMRVPIAQLAGCAVHSRWGRFGQDEISCPNMESNPGQPVVLSLHLLSYYLHSKSVSGTFKATRRVCRFHNFSFMQHRPIAPSNTTISFIQFPKFATTFDSWCSLKSQNQRWSKFWTYVLTFFFCGAVAQRGAWPPHSWVF